MDLVGNKVISAFLQLLNFSVDVVVVYKKGAQNPKKGDNLLHTVLHTCGYILYVAKEQLF